MAEKDPGAIALANARTRLEIACAPSRSNRAKLLELQKSVDPAQRLKAQGAIAARRGAGNRDGQRPQRSVPRSRRYRGETRDAAEHGRAGQKTLHGARAGSRRADSGGALAIAVCAASLSPAWLAPPRPVRRRPSASKPQPPRAPRPLGLRWVLLRSHERDVAGWGAAQSAALLTVARAAAQSDPRDPVAAFSARLYHGERGRGDRRRLWRDRSAPGASRRDRARRARWRRCLRERDLDGVIATDEKLAFHSRRVRMLVHGQRSEAAETRRLTIAAVLGYSRS